MHILLQREQYPERRSCHIQWRLDHLESERPRARFSAPPTSRKPCCYIFLFDDGTWQVAVGVIHIFNTTASENAGLVELSGDKLLVSFFLFLRFAFVTVVVSESHSEAGCGKSDDTWREEDFITPGRVAGIF